MLARFLELGLIWIAASFAFGIVLGRVFARAEEADRARQQRAHCHDIGDPMAVTFLHSNSNASEGQRNHG